MVINYNIRGEEKRRLGRLHRATKLQFKLHQNLWPNPGKNKRRAGFPRLRDKDSPQSMKNRKMWNLSGQRSWVPVTWVRLINNRSVSRTPFKSLRLILHQWAVRWWKIRFTVMLKILLRPKNYQKKRYSVRNKCTVTESSTIFSQSNLILNSQQNSSEKQKILKTSSLANRSTKFKVRARWSKIGLYR